MNNPEVPFGLESFDLEAIWLRATRHEIVYMSHGRGATRLEPFGPELTAEGLVDKSLDRLMAERQRRSQVLLRNNQSFFLLSRLRSLSIQRSMTTRRPAS